MSRQRLLGATLAWLAVVATVSALVWVVISRAGDDLVASDRPRTTSGTTQASEAPATPSRRPSRTPSKRPSATPSATPSGTPSATPSATSSPSATVTPSASPSTTPPSSPNSPSSPTGQPSAPATEQRRTWQGQPGSIVATCGTAAAPVVTVQPANGFHAEVHREDAFIGVEFEGREDESGLHVSVMVRCVAGVPAFSAQSEQDD